MLRSDAPESGDGWGATSLATHRATASAIGQRSLINGEKATVCLSGKTTASSVTTSVAMHSPGPSDWWRWVKDGKFRQPQLTWRGYDVGLRRRGWLVG